MPHELSSDALSLALRAHAYAQDAATDPWQFALSIRELETAGLTLTDARWLLLRGYASLAKEVTAPGDPARLFRPLPFTALTRSAYLMLTEAGAAELSRRLAAQQTTPGSDSSLSEPPTAPESHPPRPHWDAGRRELLVGTTVVKRFRVPAPNQELVLQAFEEDGWPACIDDPLPPVPNLDCQYRLRATIKSLNRSQSRPLIRFHGNGGGQVIYWDLAASSHAISPSHRSKR